jgi:hypothetical protein
MPLTTGAQATLDIRLNFNFWELLQNDSFWAYHKPVLKFWSNSVWQRCVRVISFVALIFSCTDRL